jgi:TonB-dependent starch-binding outer membrane protein SusC
MNMGKLLYSIGVPVLLLFSFASFAQDKVITGRVTDSIGNGIANVSVTVKEAPSRGTTTTADGRFSLSVPPNATKLVFSSVGYSYREMPISGTSMNVALQSNSSDLNTVVVIAYGSRRKTDLTGSVTSVSAKDFQKGVINSSEQLLTGKVAGLQVTSAGGSAAGGSRIRIRNGASLNASNDPLIVIDGVPVESNGIDGKGNLLNMINPNDIESMTVLKDASATALYGSRASNGVLIITTKRGTSGKFKFNFTTQPSVSKIAQTVDVLNGNQIRDIINADAVTSGSDTYKKLLGTANTDWQSQIFQTALGWDNNLSASGSLAGFIPVRLSLGYNYQEGILKTNKFDRKSVSLNATPKFFDDHLSVNVNAKFAQTGNRWANEGAVGSAVAFDPTQPVYKDNKYGGYYEWLQADGKPIDLSTRNPLALLELRNNTSTFNRVVGNVQLDYKLHFLPDLHIQANLGLDNAKEEGDDNTDSLSATSYKLGGSRSHYKHSKSNTLADISLFYAKEIKSIKSNFDVLVLHSYQDFVTNIYNYPSFSYRVIADPIHPELKDTLPNSKPTFATDKPEYRLESYLGRLNYTYNNKYLLTASLRRDASSKFSPSTRVGYFPAVAFAWKLKEDFFESSNVINDFKLRLGWGVTGQQDVRNLYPYMPRYSQSTSSAQYQFDSTFYSLLRPSAYDANIKWETTTTSNIGLDVTLLNNRISGSIDIYKKKTEDLLSVIPIAPGSNFDITLLTNVGNMENKGVELTLNTTPIKTSTVTWDLGFNYTYNKSEITNLLKQPDPNFKGIDVSGISGGTGNNIGKFAVGYAPYTFNAFKQVYDEQGKPIEGLFEDINRDGKIDDLDRYYYKKPAPDVLIGASTQVSYKKFTLGLAGHGMFGNYEFNNYNANSGVLRSIKNPINFIGNASVDYLNTNFVNNRYLSDYYIENASFFRLDNINLGYSFGKVWKNKANLTMLASVQNVFIVTKYTGLDPEIASDTGVNNTIYPRPRIYSVRANLDF